MDKQFSEIIALRGVKWLASHEEEFQAFSALTGLTIESTQSRIEDLDFLASVLDFILSSEKRLLAFCKDINIPPQTPLEARQFLPGGDVPHWT